MVLVRLLSALSSHLKYSAQLHPTAKINQKIAELLQYSEAMSMEKLIAGFVFDEFSSENHAINMAKAWVAYHQGTIEATEQELMASLDVKDSMLLSAHATKPPADPAITSAVIAPPTKSYIKGL